MISCNDYDYIEIVCLYRYPVRLTLKSGQTIEGKALDTARNQDKQEAIKLEQNGVEQLVVLDDLSLLEILVDNPHFNQKSFA
ncbi:Rho-binding antiterminator [Vibrio brasiliensis]|jgi:Rho-binding antiterminator|uniref:Rho-binding antiterminator n=1 Tax=Vibrio brasiliensis TaxID=170652 RepID=UPI001EFD8306|nr:Rho-binding antiterminator [Vibrio brasiliensis]MCG9783990.1 Rho-binding antiterminator [Vibrio brasiliensis]